MSKTEQVIPLDAAKIDIQILSNSGESFPGQMTVKKWTDAERRTRAFRRTTRLVGTIFACSLIGLFVHILLLIIIPGLLVTVFSIAPIFQKFLGEESTFFGADGECPYCKAPRKLRPYLDTQLRERVTLQCPECGQTSQALVGAGNL